MSIVEKVHWNESLFTHLSSLNHTPYVQIELQTYTGLRLLNNCFTIRQLVWFLSTWGLLGLLCVYLFLDYLLLWSTRSVVGMLSGLECA